jgi:hypothetical protein
MPLTLYPRGKNPNTHWIRGYVSLRSDLDEVESRKILLLIGLELKPLGLPTLRQLYRLPYQGSSLENKYIEWTN